MITKPGKVYLQELKKRYSKSKKPDKKTIYQRIFEAEDVASEVKDKLKKQYQRLNLVQLKRQLDDKLRQLKPTKIG